MPPLIKLENICKYYIKGSETVKALDEINLEINEGESLAIVGQSGSGKSTLMNILGCLDTPTAGQYYFSGCNTEDYSDRELSVIRNRQIGFIFQSFNLIPTLNATENVELPLIYRGLSKSACKKAALEALYTVGLGERLYHYPKQMSGGQQQRVAIARALAGKPAVIMADEPTGNLDRRNSEEIMSLLLKLNKSGKTLIMITHDRRLAGLASRQINISDGKIVLGDEKIPIYRKIQHFVPKVNFHVLKRVQNN